MRIDPREPPRVAAAFAVAWFVVVTIAQSDAGVPFPIFLTIVASGVLIVSWWAARLAWAVGLGWRADPSTGVCGWPIWSIVPVALALGIAASASTGPLALRVRLGGAALLRAAPSLEAVAAADLQASPARVGLFRVRELVRSGTELRFMTSECGLVDTCGVVYAPDGPPPHRGEDTLTHLYGPWWHVEQSW